MKVIELFNDMYNKKPLPNKIKLQCINDITKDNCMYEFSPILETYTNEESGLLEDATNLATLLNLEIEIIEEKENNKIEKIPIGKYKPTHRIKKIEKKINELIDVINELIGKDKKD